MPRRPSVIGGPPFKPGFVSIPSYGGNDTTPRVFAVTPNSDVAAGGATVTVTGVNFIEDALGAGVSVAFGSVPATNVVRSGRTSLTCTVPAGTRVVSISITNGLGQTGTLASSFTYRAPQIFNLTPPHGAFTGGTKVIISGGNFTAAMAVTFGGVPVTSNFIDNRTIQAVAPAHATGPVSVEVGGAKAPLPFYFTSLTRGDDIRRNPSIKIQEQLDGSPNQCGFTVDGSSSPPLEGEEVSITDSNDGNRVLFAGVVTNVRQKFEGQTDQLAWDVTALDYTYWLNRKRPFGTYANTSVTGIVQDLCARYAPWVDFQSYVQSGLCNVNITFNGSQDFATCLNTLAKMLGAAHWYLDYNKTLHFFKVTGAQGFTLPDSSIPGGDVNGDTASQPGLGSAATLAITSNILPSSSWGGGWTAMRTTFVYDDGTESMPSLITNPVYSDGRHYFQLSNIPIGANIGSLTCARRRIYLVFLVGGGGDTWYGSAEIHDNTTTSIFLSTGPLPSSYNPGVTVTRPVTREGNFYQFPVTAAVAPPAGPSVGPSVQDASNRGDYILAVRAGLAGPNSSGSWSPGKYAFKTTNVYADGTESQASPASGNYTSDGHTGQIITVPAAPDLNGVPVIWRNVYAAIGWSGFDNYEPDWIQRGYVLKWDIIPGNSALQWPSADAALGSGNPPGTGANQLDPCTAEGPYLEDALPQPHDVDDADLDLLRDSAGVPVGVERDITQLRNRVYVMGAGSTTSAAVLKGTVSIPVLNVAGMPQGLGQVFVESLSGGFTLDVAGAAMTTSIGIVTRVGQSGPGLVYLRSGLPVDLPSGTRIRPTLTINNIASQQYMGKVESDQSTGTPSDGIHEFFVDDSSLTTMQQIANRGAAELEVFAWPIVTVVYSTRDKNSIPGRKVHFDLTDPPIAGDFLINSVSIDQVHDEVDSLGPRYTVTASSVRWTLEDLLLTIASVASSPGSNTQTDVTGMVEQAVATAVAQIPNVALFAVKFGFGPLPTSFAGTVFTAAQRNALSTTPLSVITGVAGKVIVPIFWSFSDIRGTSGFNSTRNLNLLYTALVTSPVVTLQMEAGASTSPSKRFALGGGTGAAVTYDDTTDPVGLDLQIKQSGDTTGGTDAVWEFVVVYYLADRSTT